MTAIPLPAPSDVLDYERLFADYRTGLVDRLRGFGPAAECLSLWVPDEDHATSLRNLWDAAASAGETEIAVYIGASTVAMLDEDDVLATAARFGVATLSRGRAGWLVEVEALRPADAKLSTRPSGPEGERRANEVTRRAPTVYETAAALPTATPKRAVHAMYAAAIAAAAEHPLHEGKLFIAAGVEHLEVQEQGVALTLAVEPTTHRIRHAAFRGAPTGHRGVMERFCTLLEGSPILDAADHGVQRLEFALREHWATRPVAGIVTPRAADPCFEIPLALIRGALAVYRQRTGYAERVSAHDPGPRASWLALAPSARQAAIRTVLDRFVTARGGSPTDIELLAIEYDVRLVLRVGERMTADGPGLVLDIERALRDAIDPRLEVVLEEIRDKNRLRRLAIVES